MNSILFCAVTMIAQSLGSGERPYLDAAENTARWLQSVAIPTEHGLAWPRVPGEQNNEPIGCELYSGFSGVVLFFLEAHDACKNPAYLDQAKRGGDEILARLPALTGESFQAGLYTGVAGIGFVLEELFAATHEQKYRDGATQCLHAILKRAKVVDDGIEWSDTTDVIAGSAGTGLFLLYAAERMQEKAALDAAAKAGNRLLKLGIAESGGLKWRMDPSFQRLMPNFSHGTAGVAYFLACLHDAAGGDSFLKGATDGAHYLISNSSGADDGFLLFHSEPDRKDLFYYGWCHGPTGTARLFERLFQITGDEQWRSWTKRCMHTLRTCGIPKVQLPGFWNNVSQCCGNAGVAELFLGMHRVEKLEEDLSFARAMTDDVIARATNRDGALCWSQAEHRIKPELLQAQTGYMQGAAGIGLLLLHVDAAMKGRPVGILLPDEPFVH